MLKRSSESGRRNHVFIMSSSLSSFISVRSSQDPLFSAGQSALAFECYQIKRCFSLFIWKLKIISSCFCKDLWSEEEEYLIKDDAVDHSEGSYNLGRPRNVVRMKLGWAWTKMVAVCDSDSSGVFEYRILTLQSPGCCDILDPTRNRSNATGSSLFLLFFVYYDCFCNAKGDTS